MIRNNDLIHRLIIIFNRPISCQQNFVISKISNVDQPPMHYNCKKETCHPVNRYIAHKHSSLFKPDLILWYDGKTCRFVCNLVFSCLHMDAVANTAVVCNSKQRKCDLFTTCGLLFVQSLGRSIFYLQNVPENIEVRALYSYFTT